MSAAEIANRILEAYKSGVPIAPVRTEVSGLAAAYAVQRATFDAWLKAGRKPAGHKIGLTSNAVQEQLGVHEPDYGALFGDMILENGAHIGPRAVLQPRVEPEVAFVLKTDLAGENLTADQVIAATDYVVPAVEVCGSLHQRLGHPFRRHRRRQCLVGAGGSRHSEIETGLGRTRRSPGPGPREWFSQCRGTRRGLSGQSGKRRGMARRRSDAAGGSSSRW